MAKLTERHKLKILAIVVDDDKLGYTDFEIYCLMITGMDWLIANEEYELCALIRDYLQREDMLTLRDNFTEEFKIWTETKKIF